MQNHKLSRLGHIFLSEGIDNKQFLKWGPFTHFLLFSVLSACFCFLRLKALVTIQSNSKPFEQIMAERGGFGYQSQECGAMLQAPTSNSHRFRNRHADRDVPACGDTLKT